MHHVYDYSTALGLFQKGQRIIVEHIIANRQRDAELVFFECWKLIIQHEQYFKPISKFDRLFGVGNRFEIHWHFPSFRWLLLNFRKLFPKFQPTVLTSGASIKPQSGPGILLMSPHSGIESSLFKLSSQSGYCSAVISAAAELYRRTRAERIQSYRNIFQSHAPVEIIPRDKLCLYNVVKAIRQSYAVVANFDYTLFDPDQSRHLLFVSRGLVDFARIRNFQTYWAFPIIDDRARVCVVLREFHCAAPNAETAFRLMREGGAIVGYDFEKYELGNWFHDTGGKPNQTRKKLPLDL